MCTGRIASVVSFGDEKRLEHPRWQYLSPAEFQKILEGFEASDQLEEWIRKGALELEGWAESSGVYQRKPD